MGCTKIIKTDIECVNCEAVISIPHAQGSSPVLKAQLRNIECKNCKSKEFKLKE